MADEEQKAIQERFKNMFPELYERSKLPYYYHEKRGSLIVKPVALKEAVQFARKNCIDSIEINGKEIDLSPLEGTSGINAIHLTGNLKNVDVLYNLPLKYLYLDNTNNKGIVDLSAFSQLQNLTLVKKRKNIMNLSACKLLSVLCLYDYSSNTRDLSELKTLYNLQRLELTYAKIETIKGIEKLGLLQDLTVNYSRTLTSVDVFAQNGSLNNLVNLEIDHCPNILTYAPISNLGKLKSLSIKECKIIDTRSFLSQMNSLEYTYISNGTLIVDENIKIQ